MSDDPGSADKRRIELHVPAITIIKLLFAAVIVVALIWLSPLLMSLFISTLIAVTLHPLVAWFRRRGRHRLRDRRGPLRLPPDRRAEGLALDHHVLLGGQPAPAREDRGGVRTDRVRLRGGPDDHVDPGRRLRLHPAQAAPCAGHPRPL